MSIDNVVLWYEKNVNYKLTTAFLKFLIKIGIIKEDVNIDLLNLFLLEVYDNDFVKENDRFKIKSNRIPIIDSFNNKAKSSNKDGKPIITKERTGDKPKNKFKIENLGGKRLKLVKL